MEDGTGDKSDQPKAKHPFLGIIAFLAALLAVIWYSADLLAEAKIRSSMPNLNRAVVQRDGALAELGEKTAELSSARERIEKLESQLEGLSSFKTLYDEVVGLEGLKPEIERLSSTDSDGGGRLLFVEFNLNVSPYPYPELPKFDMKFSDLIGYFKERGLEPEIDLGVKIRPKSDAFSLIWYYGKRSSKKTDKPSRISYLLRPDVKQEFGDHLESIFGEMKKSDALQGSYVWNFPCETMEFDRSYIHISPVQSEVC